MKILIINDLIVGGGVENVLLNLVTYLCRIKEYEVSVISLENQRKEFEEIYPSTVNYHSYSLKCCKNARCFTPKWLLVKSVERIYRMKLRKKKYDVVIALKEGGATIVGQKFQALKKFAWVHVDYQSLYWTKACYGSAQDEIACMKNYNKVVCVSNAAMRSVCEVIGNPGNLIVKLNPINVKDIVNKSNENIKVLDSYLGEKRTNRITLVSVGRLCEQKAYQRLLRVCERLNKEFDYELWIIGDGPERTLLELQIKEKALNNVILWGQQNNPYPFMKHADWLVSASLGESYGLTLQEALIIGIPVFAANCAAFEECVLEKEAILVRNEEEEIYKGLRSILKDKNLRNMYADAIDKSRTHEKLFDQRLEEIEKLWM